MGIDSTVDVAVTMEVGLPALQILAWWWASYLGLAPVCPSFTNDFVAFCYPPSRMLSYCVYYAHCQRNLLGLIKETSTRSIQAYLHLIPDCHEQVVTQFATPEVFLETCTYQKIKRQLC